MHININTPNVPSKIHLISVATLATHIIRDNLCDCDLLPKLSQLQIHHGAAEAH